MKQCGNINGRSKSTPSLCPPKPLTKLSKKRKRAKGQKGHRSSRTGQAYVRRRSYTYSGRRRKPRLSARRASRQTRSESSSISVDENDNDSISSCKRPRRSISKRKGASQASTSYTESESYQESIPASKHMSLDASQYNPAIEMWDLTMAQAGIEPLEAHGYGTPRRSLAEARGTSPKKS